jgi:hypothetical protein
VTEYSSRNSEKSTTLNFLILSLHILFSFFSLSFFCPGSIASFPDSSVVGPAMPHHISDIPASPVSFVFSFILSLPDIFSLSGFSQLFQRSFSEFESATPFFQQFGSHFCCALFHSVGMS